MKAAVVGPGAIGCMVSARLASAGHSVTVVDHDRARAGRLQAQGIRLQPPDGDEITVKVSTAVEIPTGCDLILVLVKAHHTENITFPPETPVLTLQNGLGNVERLCNILGSARVLAGATMEAATLTGEGSVHHVSRGLTRVGSWTSCDPAPAIELLQSASFQVEKTEAPGQMIWEKVAVNAGINPLTAMLNVANGKLLELPEIRPLMRDLVVEAAKVASTEGYRFPYSLVELAEEVCENTRENISSMLQDVRAGRKTEIEALSGEILRRAQLASLPTPRTRVIYQLVRGMEGR